MQTDELAERLAALGDKHRDLGVAIVALEGQREYDQLQMARLKKGKLRVRDEIETVKDLLRPDIIV